MWIYYYSNVIVYITTPPLGTLADWLGDSGSNMDTPSTVVDDVNTPTRARSSWMLMLSTVAMRRTKFPKHTRCRITNIQKQLLAPCVVYAEFESILQRVGDEAMDTTQGVAVGGDEPTPAVHTSW